MWATLSCRQEEGSPAKPAHLAGLPSPRGHSLPTWATWAVGRLSVPSSSSHLILFSLLRDPFLTAKLAVLCWLPECEANSIQTQLIDLMPSFTARQGWITTEPAPNLCDYYVHRKWAGWQLPVEAVGLNFTNNHFGPSF